MYFIKINEKYWGYRLIAQINLSILKKLNLPDNVESPDVCLDLLNGLLKDFGLKKNFLRDCGGVGQLCVITFGSKRIRGFVGRVFGNFSG